ncbi:MAG: glycosyltransferase family 1 protein [Chloroflexi bacterium]|nr:glycosyltransferase family 1 protein [Chloroflexota bacterium]
MRIGLVTPYDIIKLGGVNKHVLSLARELQAMGHHVRVLAPESQEGAPENRALVMPLTSQVISVPFGGSTAPITLYPGVIPKVRQVLAEQHFDILHLHEPMAPLLPLAILMDAHLYPQTRLVGTFHAYRERPHVLQNYLADTMRRLAERLDVRIAVSEPARWFAQDAYLGTYRIIPNGVDYASFANPAAPLPIRQTRDHPTILFVGRGDPRKGLPLLLDAFELVRRAVSNAHLWVVGLVTAEERQDYIKKLKEHKIYGVKFIGPVPEAELPGYYRVADIFCAPSTGFESFGMILLEAMAAGTPVVASYIAGYCSVVTDGVNGVMVPAGDHYALAHTLIPLLQQPERRQALSQAGRAAAQNYDWSNIAQKVVEAYQDALARPRTEIAEVERHWTRDAAAELTQTLVEELRTLFVGV